MSSFSLIISGSDAAAQVVPGTLQHTATLGAVPQLVLALQAGSPLPAVGATVQLAVGGVPVFGGTVHVSRMQQQAGAWQASITARGYAALLEQRIHTAALADTTAQQALQHLLHGIPYVQAGSVPVPGQAVSRLTLQGVTAGKALEKLASMLQWQLRVGPTGVVDMVAADATDDACHIAADDLLALEVRHDGLSPNTIVLQGATTDTEPYTQRIICPGGRNTWVLDYPMPMDTLEVLIDGAPMLVDRASNSMVPVWYSEATGEIEIAETPLAGQQLLITGYPRLPLLVRVADAARVAVEGPRELMLRDDSIATRAEALRRLPLLLARQVASAGGISADVRGGPHCPGAVLCLTRPDTGEESEWVVASSTLREHEGQWHTSCQLLPAAMQQLALALADTTLDKVVDDAKTTQVAHPEHAAATIQLADSASARPGEAPAQQLALADATHHSNDGYIWVAGPYTPSAPQHTRRRQAHYGVATAA